MQKIIIIIIISNFLFSYSQKNNNYFEYHKLINKAEYCFLVSKNKDSSLFYYDKCFNEFDFIFVKDAVNAAQIAYFTKKDYKKYLIKGFEHGLKIEHLKLIKLFDKEIKKISDDSFLNEEYLNKRKIYLKTIDLDYLNIIYEYGVQDQIDKSLYERKEYERKRKIAFSKIEKTIRKRGFPGDKLLGIADSTVYKDSKSKLKDFYKRIEDYDFLKKYFVCGDELLSQKMIYLLLIHNFCSYNNLDNIWLSEIKNGNIHPRDVALIYDNLYRSYSCEKPTIPFKNNLYVNYDKYSTISDKINKKRKELFMNSLEIDDLKKTFEKEYGFKFFWGFWGCR
ncbi:hypothetical protein FIA58_010605 [Flavobacterium jejuense]|uniref:Uncharacterized protein n=1 Tax=Flavobacterium jejuense TaxID=1544455 RepID=A0ABX0ITI6_9FLAO|nr:hypothetical protein [Flavobacterium jejuense]NHN26127.1 hypothetical protein [Flavobacterium jejuense]